jgi:5-methylcytosine-specific restriction protein A
MMVRTADLSPVRTNQEPTAYPQQFRGNTSARGYGWKWQKERLFHLAKHPLCVYCEETGRVTAATTVDHRIPHRGDQTLFWDRSNWQSLCTNCHSSRKQREEAAAAHGGEVARQKK